MQLKDHKQGDEAFGLPEPVGVYLLFHITIHNISNEKGDTLYDDLSHKF